MDIQFRQGKMVIVFETGHYVVYEKEDVELVRDVLLSGIDDEQTNLTVVNNNLDLMLASEG